MSKTSMDALRGTVLEGSEGLVVAALLAAVSLGLAAAQWFLLPDQVISHSQGFYQSASYMPKWMPLVISTALGVGGAAWFAGTRMKVALFVAALGLVVGAAILLMNMPFGG